MRQDLEVRLFGVPDVRSNGVPVAVSVRPLCVVLLAMLVLTEPDRRRPRKSVAADLWPDDDEVTAATNLRRHLSFLVAALPEANACIGRDREALWWYRKNAPWCDVVEFERGEFDLYTADFMEGFTHEWVVAQRERLRGNAVAAFVRRAETLRDDDATAALSSVRRAIDIDPLDESTARLEIELLGERGDNAGMDAAYTSLARRLEDIDAAPSREIVALVDRFHVAAREAGARLPRPITTFVGTAIVDDVAALASAHRLLTIVGPGGVGKTRLALEAAQRLAPAFGDGAYFVDLSTVTDGDALPAALGRALGLPTNLAARGLAGVHSFLQNRRALLILDTCERVAESCSWFLSDLLSLAPYVHVLATSREALGLRSERRFSLAPLNASDAVALFTDRAQSAAWTAGDATAARIASVCARLDGLPLALELAASLLGTVSLADLELQLEAGGELRSRDPTIPARHRSIADVIAWSVGLLDAREREAFTHLAVFAGSFSAAAAKGVCDVDVATLAELVAASVLVRKDAVAGRFAFLISVGDYARRLQNEHPSANAVRSAHASWFATIAMRSTERTFWSSERTWLDEIDRDYANVARALQWSLSDAGEPESGIRLAIGLAHYFVRRKYLSEGVSWLQRAYARTTPGSLERAELSVGLALIETGRGHFEAGLDLARSACVIFARDGLERELARAINAQAALLIHLGRNAEAKPLLERALPLAQRSNDRRCEAIVRSNFAYLLSSAHCSTEAREAYVSALRSFEEAGHAGGAARTRNAIAACDFNAGRFDAAIENLERALEYERSIGDLGSAAGVLSDLGDVAYVRGDVARARDYYAEALALWEAHESELTYDSVLSGFAALAATEGRARDAARLLGAARPREDAAKTPAHSRVYERARTLAEETLGIEECRLEIRFGSELSRTDAVKLARTVLEPVLMRPLRRM